MLLAYAVMALVWPWSVVDPRNPFRAVEYFSRFFEEPWEELFGGVLIPVPDMPRSYVPTLLALKLPEIFLVLGFGGAAGALIAALRRDIAANRRAILLLVALAALLPLAVDRVAAGDNANGIRHFVLCCRRSPVLGGLAGTWLTAALARQFRFAPLVAADLHCRHRLAADRHGAAAPLRIHALQLAGGRRQARARPLLDYWGSPSSRPRRPCWPSSPNVTRGKPAGRRWKIAVCGPHRSPQVELGPDFETTWDPQGADFAMMLGVFYCAKLDAPVLAEVERGVSMRASTTSAEGRSRRCSHATGAVSGLRASGVRKLPIERVPCGTSAPAAASARRCG